LIAVSHFISVFLDIFKTHWKLICQVGLVIWVVICSLSHCGGGGERVVSKTDTVVVERLVYDTAWKSLIGDTIAHFEQKLQRRRWTVTAPDLSTSVSCQDSLKEFVLAFKWCDDKLSDCDSTFRNDYALRRYKDTFSNDTVEIDVDIETKGKLNKPIEYKFRRMLPDRTIERTIENTVVVGPFRSIYVEGSVGARFMTEFQAVEVDLGLGYQSKNNWSYGIRGGFSTVNDYNVKIVLRKNFNLKF
tara:strand:+ start:295 stop:1029 length:735 start_codon:yes stop_codon:yes gene_type:complete